MFAQPFIPFSSAPPETSRPYKCQASRGSKIPRKRSTRAASCDCFAARANALGQPDACDAGACSGAALRDSAARLVSVAVMDVILASNQNESRDKGETELQLHPIWEI